MKQFTERMALHLTKKEIICKGQEAIYKYGLEVLFSSFFMVTVLLILASIIGNFFETIAFFFAFIPLRIYAGGYHSKTRIHCYISSMIIYGCFSITLQVSSFIQHYKLSLIISIFVAIMVLPFAPVIHDNHRVSRYEYFRYRLLSIVVYIVELLLLVLGYIFWGQNQLIYAFSLGMFFEGVLIVFEKMREKIML